MATLKAGSTIGGVEAATTSSNVASATKLATTRTIGLTGDVSGSTSFDGSGNATITATVANDSHTHGDSTINGLDASAITTGTISDSRLGTVSASKLTGALPAIDGSSLTGVGNVLQVVATTVTTVNSTTNTNTDAYSNIGLEVTITPKSSTSKFHISCTVGVGTVTGAQSWGLILFRNTTKIGNGTDSSSRNGVWCRGVDHAGGTGSDPNHGIGTSGSHFDTTSGTAGTAMTYKAGGVAETGGTMWINMQESNSDLHWVYCSYTNSTITVMEVEG